MKVRIVKNPDYYVIETKVWYWPFWTYRNLFSRQSEAEAWAKHYVNPDIKEVK